MNLWFYVFVYWLHCLYLWSVFNVLCWLRWFVLDCINIFVYYIRFCVYHKLKLKNYNLTIWFFLWGFLLDLLYYILHLSTSSKQWTLIVYIFEQEIVFETKKNEFHVLVNNNDNQMRPATALWLLYIFSTIKCKLKYSFNTETMLCDNLYHSSNI